MKQNGITHMKYSSLMASFFSDLFLVLLFLYLAAVRIDLSFDGVVSRAVNLNLLLITCIIAGVVAIVFPGNTDEEASEMPPRRLWAYIIVLSIMVASIVTKILEPLSSWALLIGGAGGFVVFLAGSAMMLRDHKREAHE